MQENDPRLVIGATAPTRSLVDVTTPHPWVTAARDYLGPSNTLLNACTAAIAHLAAEWEDNRTGDPWLDAGFADLFNVRLEWLRDLVFDSAEPRVSDAETALLVTFPYVHQAFWAKLTTATLKGADPAVQAFAGTGALRKFGAYAAEHDLLHRRGTRLFESGDPAAHNIAWWLFRRWLAENPECYSTKNMAALLPTGIPEPLNEVLTPARLTELMRVVQIDSAFLRRADRRSRLESIKYINGGSKYQQHLREQLMGYLLVVAHRTAIDPIALPRDVVGHIGIDNDRVALDEVLTSIRKAGWPGGRTMVLTAVCTHPATARALRKHVDHVNSVLAEIAFAAEDPGHLKPLRNVPVHASADGLTIEHDGDGEHAPDSFGHRFQLADDKIQRLLMGRQLYGASELAIRELYQNALDACRYRQARMEYLAHPLSDSRVSLPAWNGQISFHQGMEAGRPFLDCKDNGIGMSDRELIDVFATAGVTFTTMPEYLEEQADWAAAGIECYPNSRFGIGVLSYFMLADEITVTTCRLNREGRPDRLLRVHIAGPGALFRVKDLGPGKDADVGTTVRLHLRPADSGVHCTDLLRRILWISDYLVTSEDPSSQQTWEPQRLSQMAPIGSDDALDKNASRKVDVIVAAPGGAVWWCDTTGAVLADGIWAGTAQFGAIVNLEKANAPRLTVDRRTIIDLDHELVEELLHAAVPSLFEAPDSVLSHGWLSTLSESIPRLADAICERAVEAGYRPWRIAGFEVPIESVGCLPEDERIMSSFGIGMSTLSNRISNWRLSAWLSSWPRHTSPTVTKAAVPARPSDQILLRSTRSKQRYGSRNEWLSDDAPPSLGHILSVACRARLSPAEVAARLAVMGYEVVDQERLPLTALETDSILLSKWCTGDSPWLDADEPVTHDHVIVAAINAGIAPGLVVKRLTDLGFKIPSVQRLPAAVRPSDLQLIRPAGIPDRSPRLDVRIPVAHVLITAAQAGRTPAEVARRLEELGYTAPDLDDLPRDHDRHDSSVFVDESGAYVQQAVPLAHITLAAIKSGRSTTQISARLTDAGIKVPSEEMPTILPSDAALTCVYDPAGNDLGPMSASMPITVGHVLCAASQTPLSPTEVAVRLVELGFSPPLGHLPDEVLDGDLMLVSSAIGDIQYADPENHWFGIGQVVSVQHVVIAAVKTRRTPLAVSRRLAELGFTVPPDHALDFDAAPDDLTLLSSALDGAAPWLHADHPAMRRSELTLPVGHVLAAAARIGVAPSRVAERLTVLGLRREPADLPAKVDGLDSRLLRRVGDTEEFLEEHPDEFLWLNATEPATSTHLLICAARTGLSPADVALRLSALGIPTVDPAGLPLEAGRDDLVLLSQDLSGEGPFGSLDEEFARGHVLHAALATRRSPAQVLDRLKQLGIRVSD